MVVVTLVVELALVHGGPVVLPGSHCFWAAAGTHKATVNTHAASSFFMDLLLTDA